ncbi:GNAT family N-acetyltransferase [Candidatus Woesearchaeota archaeon]|nr:GNAT family N-acetyltransferase [Candidatus Woesearchaeota archaeon]
MSTNVVVRVIGSDDCIEYHFEYENEVGNSWIEFFSDVNVAISMAINVNKDCRGQGLGKSLYAFVEEYAKNLGAKRILADERPLFKEDVVIVKNFYDGCGFEKLKRRRTFKGRDHNRIKLLEH